MGAGRTVTPRVAAALFTGYEVGWIAWGVGWLVGYGIAASLGMTDERLQSLLMGIAEGAKASP